MFKKTIIKKINRFETPYFEAFNKAKGSPPLNSIKGKRVRKIERISSFIF